MNILFLGGVFPKILEKHILDKSKGAVFYPANKFQNNIIDGLMDIQNVSLEILSALFIGTYPFEYKELYIKEKSTTYKECVPHNCVEFCNLWGYRNISRKNALIKKIRNFSYNNVDDKAIIIYSPHTPFLQAAVYAKKIDPSIHICLIVPDLPQFMNLNNKRSFIYKTLKSIDIKAFENNCKYVDSFVLLTEQMKDKLNVANRPYIVVEGIVNSEGALNQSFISKDRIQSIVYTGTLNKKFGVVNLVEAFHRIEKKDIKLEICGRGDSENIIKEYANRDKRIHYYGQVSNDRALKLQQNATILVNPRQNNEEFTKYSFPSKNMEYLLTGKPVIAYKLDGIPNEYDDYFYYVESNTVDSLSNKIIEVLNIPELERIELADKAKKFVLKNKNSSSVGMKIIELIYNQNSRL